MIFASHLDAVRSEKSNSTLRLLSFYECVVSTTLSYLGGGAQRLPVPSCVSCRKKKGELRGREGKGNSRESLMTSMWRSPDHWKGRAMSDA